ncbi:lsm12, putative [Plasmodium vinckei lentum]|uniref:Lsm12, putative n=1 Tax=Plasmodium vinckei lentum TaxID=138297 RepID=A0A6V7RST6_PLAVN|nr:lsm12, putative [Plasmodium vinckei lentum]
MVKNSIDPSLYFGHIITAKTSSGDKFEGELYCYDTCSNFIILKDDNKNGTANFYIIRTHTIVDIEIKEKLKVLYEVLPKIDKTIVEKIERKSIENFEKKKSRIGIRVTHEAQELFDFIWKTHPDCTWSNRDILVLNGEVRIKHPYGPDDCTAKNEKLRERFITVVIINKYQDFVKRRPWLINDKENNMVLESNDNNLKRLPI